MDSPTPSSLHHSYETLNMYEETGFAGNGGGAPKTPHRPAPPVPSAKNKNSSFGGKTMTTQSGDDIQVPAL